MHTRAYGRGRLTVPALGLGAGQIGDAALDEAAVALLLNTALDLGVTLIDTARGYGLSEERIGRHLAHRRSEFVLSTKLGYGIPGHADWTAGAVAAGVDEALRRLRTEHLDIVHLHSCALDVLQSGDVLRALEAARDAGKVGTVAYSGENEALAWAVDSGRCGGVECSVNLFDQGSLAETLPRAAAQGLGVIAKRPLGNAPWRFTQRPAGDYAEAYWERLQALALDTAGLHWDELALRFVAFQPGVSCAIAGTASVHHLRHNAALVARGPLAAETMAAIRRRFAEVGGGWRGEV
jgi:aryl-alcohol dehydrogenase-like predicted oxidoreductase